MPYGYGKVAFSTFVGFFLGIYLQYKNPNSVILSYIGYLLLLVGILSMVLNRKTVTGIPGGLLTGIGLGVTLASEPGFDSWLHSFVHSLRNQ